MLDGSTFRNICCLEVDAGGINCLLVIGNNVIAGNSKGNFDPLSFVSSQK
jgi:hypothetical protein